MLRGRDPSAVAVLMEDSAAVAGVFVAATALGITHWTGNTMYDAIGSISIGGKCNVCNKSKQLMSWITDKTLQ